MNDYRVYLRRDRELCREVLRTDDRQYAIDALNGAIQTATEPLQGWISGPMDLATRRCEEVAHLTTAVEPRKPTGGRYR